jgi:hypothetical protein
LRAAPDRSANLIDACAVANRRAPNIWAFRPPRRCCRSATREQSSSAVGPGRRDYCAVESRAADAGTAAFRRFGVYDFQKRTSDRGRARRSALAGSAATRQRGAWYHTRVPATARDPWEARIWSAPILRSAPIRRAEAVASRRAENPPPAAPRRYRRRLARVEINRYPNRRALRHVRAPKRWSIPKVATSCWERLGGPDPDHHSRLRVRW